jgi:hypothetical protein
MWAPCGCPSRPISRRHNHVSGRELSYNPLCQPSWSPVFAGQPCYNQKCIHNIFLALSFLQKKCENPPFSIGNPIDMSKTSEYT